MNGTLKVRLFRGDKQAMEYTLSCPGGFDRCVMECAEATPATKQTDWEVVLSYVAKYDKAGVLLTDKMLVECLLWDLDWIALRTERALKAVRKAGGIRLEVRSDGSLALQMPREEMSESERHEIGVWED